MGVGIYPLVLFFITDLCLIEGQRSIVLHREKRRWITGVFKLVEEDPGPYPKKTAKVSNILSQNYSLVYSLSGEGVDQDPEKNLFTINKVTGEIFVNRKVDREKTKIFKFQANALSRDTLKEVDDHMLYKIVVIDVNDNAPKFKQTEYNVDVLESTLPGTEIIRIEAEDPDDKTNGNGVVSYFIDSQHPAKPSNIFHINLNNGSILLQKCLNYEAIKSYDLDIKAKDNGLNVLSSSVKVKINVIDSNNNPPIFTQKNVTGSIEEFDKGVVILQVSVTDKDTPNTPAWRAKYKVIEGNENGNYKMETDPKTNDGQLILIKSLDYEVGPVRNIKITVENEEPLFVCPGMKDNIHVESQKLTAVITVKDTNDPPVFTPPVLLVYEYEGQKPGKVLGRFNATDTDKFYKHSIRYYRGHEPAEWVTVDSETGVVTTLKEMDRESLYVKKNVYTFTVHAVEDSIIPVTGTGTMSIILSDVNDNLPYLKTTYEEMCDDGKIPFITVAASDADLEPFGGPFAFELLDNEQNVKENWKLCKATDNTVQLERIRQVPVGYYSIPFKIRDRQGITQECTLNLRVCHCTDGKTCPVPRPTTAFLGGAAVGLLFVGLLFLILGLCLLPFCTFKKRLTKPYNEPMWSLIKYNDEGNVVENPMPARVHSLQIVSNEIGLGHEQKQSRNFSIQENVHGKEMFPYGHDSLIHKTRRHNIYGWANGHNLKLDTDDSESVCQPRIYSYEGEEESGLTLDSICKFEDNISFNFLDDLEPNFKGLAKICQERNLE
ncbi:cadherin-like protein 26 isoform X2 [Narcine bancroftii]|uniref:cadherin-like protein 26 isoform X2 n=1 Tax=Narcine bancroftii TaxID=1343680 RepID=UPI003831FFA8